MWVGGDHEGESEFEAFEPLRDMRLEPVQMDEWELPPHEIIMNQKISDGNFGEVYKASIVSVTRHVKPGTQVAVKMLKCEFNHAHPPTLTHEHTHTHTQPLYPNVANYPCDIANPLN